MSDEFYIKRCLELAAKGAGTVAPNPMVGALLVHDGLIIGEGYHQQYGQAHAEVHCINQAIRNGYADILHQSTLYVSLEPCAHVGKTPPCADLIISKKIPKVVIGCSDPFVAVNGKGIEKMEKAGILVVLVKEELAQACRHLNKRFFTFHTQHRPYIVLKWAQTGNGLIAGTGTDRLLISNEYTNRLVHQWRSEEASILVGTNTALLDNPALTAKLWTGNSPVRLVMDLNLRLPLSLQVFDQSAPTIVFNNLKEHKDNNLHYHQLIPEKETLSQVVHALYKLKIQSLMVEGGAALLQSFIDLGLWDEARIITNTNLRVSEGLAAPVLKQAVKTNALQILTDQIDFYQQQKTGS